MAAPTLDGSAVGKASSTNVNTIYLTTSLPNDIIVLMAYAEVGRSGTQSAITSVSGGGLTWTRRAVANASGQSSLELWYAVATTALSFTSITMTYAANFDDASASAFGVNGCNLANPWDSHGNFPATQSLTVDAAPSFTVSTNNAEDFLIFAVATSALWSAYPGTLPMGFSTAAMSQNNGGALFAFEVVAYKQVTAVQSASTFTWGSTIPATYNSIESIFDALAGGSSAPPAIAKRPQVFICT